MTKLSRRINFLFWVGMAWLGAVMGAAENPSSSNSTLSERSPSSPPVLPVYYDYEVVHSWSHDPAAFTQGLLFRDGKLWESTGLKGRSTLREVDPETGQVLKSTAVPSEYFAEGLAVLGSHFFQLTWQNHQGFIYDDTLKLIGEFDYDGEGWGLTTDGQSLILSDGTNRIRFLDPKTFRIERTIDVTIAGHPVARLNELEWVKGEIFANVWQTDAVIRIDPADGHVRGVVDFSGLLSSDERRTTDVLNGIAYDSVRDRLLVTGKLWPKIFEVRLKIRPPLPHG